MCGEYVYEKEFDWYFWMEDVILDILLKIGRFVMIYKVILNKYGKFKECVVKIFRGLYRKFVWMFYFCFFVFDFSIRVWKNGKDMLV